MPKQTLPFLTDQRGKHASDLVRCEWRSANAYAASSCPLLAGLWAEVRPSGSISLPSSSMLGKPTGTRLTYGTSWLPTPTQKSNESTLAQTQIFQTPLLELTLRTSISSTAGHCLEDRDVRACRVRGQARFCMPGFVGGVRRTVARAPPFW